MPHFARSIVPCSGTYNVTAQPSRASACGSEPATSASPPTLANGAASAAANATRRGAGAGRAETALWEGTGRLSGVRKNHANRPVRDATETRGCVGFSRTQGRVQEGGDV